MSIVNHRRSSASIIKENTDASLNQRKREGAEEKTREREGGGGEVLRGINERRHIIRYATNLFRIILSLN
jgi:hypothetical protein